MSEPVPAAGAAPSGAEVIAVDVGGTGIKGAVYAAGRVGSEVAVPMPLLREVGQNGIVDAVLGVIRGLRRQAPDAAAIGMVVPGLVDEANGSARYSENIGWHDVPFRAMVEEETGLPVGFGHDVRAAGLAEQRYGAGRGVEDFLFLPVGTGISGAMFSGGRLIGSPLAGEVGHLDVGSGRACACGMRGCLETVATARSIAREYTARAHRAVAGAKDVATAARDGDPIAEAVWEEAVEALATALLAYTTLLAPRMIVIGGGLSEAGDQLLSPLRESLHRRIVWQECPVVKRSAFGSRAGRAGAALLGFQAVECEDPLLPVGPDPG